MKMKNKIKYYQKIWRYVKSKWPYFIPNNNIEYVLMTSNYPISEDDIYKIETILQLYNSLNKKPNSE